MKLMMRKQCNRYHQEKGTDVLHIDELRNANKQSQEMRLDLERYINDSRKE